MKLALLFVLPGLIFAADQTKTLTEQAKRGQELFQTSPKGACVTCHLMEGKGSSVGPDLMKTAAALPPRALAMAIKATMTVYVVEAKVKAGGSFPAMKSEDGTTYWDLSQNPPVAKKFAKGEVSDGANTGWKHPPQGHGYTNEQLADIIAYLRGMAANDKKPVDPEDLQ